MRGRFCSINCDQKGMFCQISNCNFFLTADKSTSTYENWNARRSWSLLIKNHQNIDFSFLCVYVLQSWNKINHFAPPPQLHQCQETISMIIKIRRALLVKCVTFYSHPIGIHNKSNVDAYKILNVLFPTKLSIFQLEVTLFNCVSSVCKYVSLSSFSSTPSTTHLSAMKSFKFLTKQDNYRCCCCCVYCLLIIFGTIMKMSGCCRENVFYNYII